ncbi:hypothetical protein CPB83DRAFT_840807 [Crepidotus variabilis]|uniref:Uncharacterized protein n=1 Tax=Crepidotus variabilis TaxID=179855 RepID=A0A9P6JIF0_9AGAR|nr:hypothetical protein CPB83DRAFT_840807 [Crepidotus variabilis]
MLCHYGAMWYYIAATSNPKQEQSLCHKLSTIEDLHSGKMFNFAEEMAVPTSLILSWSTWCNVRMLEVPLVQELGGNSEISAPNKMYALYTKQVLKRPNWMKINTFTMSPDKIPHVMGDVCFPYNISPESPPSGRNQLFTVLIGEFSALQMSLRGITILVAVPTTFILSWNTKHNVSLGFLGKIQNLSSQ